MTTIKINDIIGTSIGVSSEDGQKVFEAIFPLLEQEKSVVLSFENMEIVISAFLNVAIGQLYGVLDEQRIKQFLSIEEKSITAEDKYLLKRVVDNAKKYFSNKETQAAYDQSWKELGQNEK